MGYSGRAAYTGDVDAYGPADFRRLPDVLVAKIGLGPSGVNGYLLRCLRTDEQLLVDAADDHLFVAAVMGSRGLSAIVTTHAHPPHVQALESLAETTFARTVAHPDDAGALPVPTTDPVGDGDVVQVGELRLTVLHLPGHSPGSIALLHSPSDGSPPHLFSGDALLRGGPGSTGTPAERAELLEALRRRVFDVLPDETWVYPGHGPDTTVGRERAALAAAAER
ncbi:MBL fold metallo-hydrolase [Trujillonella humicola]|uniref:MBL fold metallo-hydrolase n=1 Tax=Trujillonella humicola TaxID=3383699 RepID=UPI003906A8D3